MSSTVPFRPLTLASIAIALAACGGGGSGGTPPPPPPPTVRPPVITLAPESQTRIEGGVVSFDVATTGDDVHYQWLLNGEPIPGETQSRVNATGVFPPGSESTWTVEARNAGGVVRASAILKVLPNRPLLLVAGRASRNASDDPALLQNALQGFAVDNAGNYLLVDGAKVNRLGQDGKVRTFSRPAGTLNVNWCDAGSATPGKDGTVYWIDPCLHMIWKISPDGSVTAFAGGRGGYADGPRVAARFNSPTAAVLDSKGNLLVADAGNSRLRKIAPDGMVTTLAGDGKGPEAGFTGLSALAIDQQDNVFVAGVESIRKVTPDGTVSSLTIRPTGIKLGGMSGLAVDGKGVLYVADSTHHSIRRLAPDGTLTTLAGNDSDPYDLSSSDGIGQAARIGMPRGLALDAAGNMLFGDASFGVRQLSPAGVVTTRVRVPATLARDYRDGMGPDARFVLPGALAFDRHGLLHVSDFTSFAFAGAPDRVRTVSASGMVGTKAALAAAAIAFDAQDNMFTAVPDNKAGNGEIRKTTPAGVTTTVYSLAQVAGTRTVHFFSELATDDAGNVWAASNSTTLHDNIPKPDMTFCPEGYLHRIAADGSATVVAGLKPADPPAGVTMSCAFGGMARDRDGSFWVGDQRASTIRKIAPDGSITNTGVHSDIPFKLALMPDGRLVFVEFDLIRMMAADGKVTTLARTDGIVSGIAIDANGVLFLSLDTAIYKMVLPK